MGDDIDAAKADLLIVGAGTAGLPAAIEAARHGLRVTVVEQADQVGGTLWRSWAQLSAGGTALQRERGIHDSPDLHFDDVMRISKNTADPELVRLAVDHAPETVDWLMSAGFDMDPAAPAILYFHEPYTLPRTYWGTRGGNSVLEVLIPRFERVCAEGSVTLLLNTTVTALRADGPNRVAGVTVFGPDGVRADLDADHVLLTSGGYSGNAELFPQLTGGAPLVGPGAPTSTGTGLLAALDLGATTRGGDLFLPTYGGVLLPDSPSRTVPLDDYPQLTPQSRLPWEIHVNERGERFVAEDTDSVDVRERALLDQPGLRFWVVYDDAVRQKAPALFPSWAEEDLSEAFATHPSFATADTIEELGELAGVDPAGLTRSVEEYNAAVASGVDQLGREHLPLPIERAPYYAVRNHGSTLKSPAGLVVDKDLRVVGGSGPVENLYAAGEVLGGSTLSGKSFVSGMSVTPALSFGRLIGRRAAGSA
ncbi:FAD-dependent oxidoreductase [Actinophytocola algeriensis]|uniref:Fumarate reductase flavoprotein subunit n=1 Tax=Actinophytocola algeriensis TaxID=1768010 RepID=A0A7W7Q1H2_9PSEU|nr:FAD-dependent oxidoreductase [Actinophytocola algeriensis]MBB4905270.1 fumarate reductase flavoprotein subunit [Actinophytocola algeriensis]MBE1473045.1 fumarate reductase flavoprotein subunit [Actinophytocola algeriensis]